MNEYRSNPDDILNNIKKQDLKKNKGKLKIFFGYSAGVGKTYDMLQSAHLEKNCGTDVVIGYVEPHARPKTSALIQGLETIPTKKIIYNNITLQEFDLDTALKRKPQLILVDELAHTNANGSRHIKRYQDIEELLNNGIDVYTTVNVQHIESLNDIVSSITGIIVKERIPDKVFDNADQVKLVDIEPQELINRMNEGNIYKKNQVDRALNNFFTLDNLTALREIALRRCADRMNLISKDSIISDNSYFTEEHILVCISPSPSNQKIIRTASRMAKAFKGRFTALFVETSQFQSISNEDKKRLSNNIHLAEQLGAKIETVYGDDIPFQISEFARLSKVSKIVVGRFNAKRTHILNKPTLTEKLIEYSPNLDIYIIPDSQNTNNSYKAQKVKNNTFKTLDVIKSITILLISTIIGLIFNNLGFNEANIIMVYILGVLITSIITTQRGVYSLTSSIISVLVFNFLFIEPKYTLNAYEQGYPITFLIMFISAFITGNLTTKIKQQAKHFSLVAFRTKILLETNQLLQNTNKVESIISVTANQIKKLLNRDIIIYLSDNGKDLSKPFLFPIDSTSNIDKYLTENEKAVANWVLINNKHAGATTNTLTNAQCLYLAIRVNDIVYGVIGISLHDDTLESFENSIMLSILGDCALALENKHIEKERKQAEILAKNEQLRADLLRSIAHDLRTPLTSISGNANLLLSNEEKLSLDKKNQLYNNIYDDALWLINLVENLISVTKLEDGSMKLKLSPELIEDVINDALKHINRKSVEHNIILHKNNEILLANMDSKLIMQVIINIVNNAIKYTHKGSNIDIKTYKDRNFIVVEIADDGKGISNEDKEHIFDMFYTANNGIADGNRSLGLGLYLCKSIINAHGGSISVLDNSPNGTIFKFSLISQEVNINE